MSFRFFRCESLFVAAVAAVRLRPRSDCNLATRLKPDPCIRPRFVPATQENVSSSDPFDSLLDPAPASHLLGGDPIESGAGRVEGYSPRERKEVQANVFAGEFLCPSNWLREEYITRGRRPSEIAAEFVHLKVDIIVTVGGAVLR